MVNARVKTSEESALPTDSMETFVNLPSDPTGTVTFERFLWQTKLAVRTWLTTLTSGGPVAVVAEHVEDLVVVEAAVLRFAQLKTRDKGSWSAKAVTAPGHAVEKLVASYKLAKAQGILDQSKFEVWLEGPQAEAKQTTTFFADPSGADEEIKKRIRGFGIKGAELTDFLSRLTITCYLPSRQSIDAVVQRSIGAAWPHLTFHQVELLYERLLDAASSAQASAEPPASMRRALKAAGTADMEHDGTWAPIARQTLHRNQLRPLCPPLSAETNEELLARAAAGHATMLELKLVRAGASAETIAAAIGARADAEIASTLARSSGRATEEDLEVVADRILILAGSMATLSASTPGPSPAESVFHGLMSRPADVLSTDPTAVFNGDQRLLVGELCNLSDQCKFGWGVK